jgi:hypothetical protein
MIRGAALTLTGLWHFTTKTPLHSIQSILYVDMKKPNSVFVKVITKVAPLPLSSLALSYLLSGI